VLIADDHPVIRKGIRHLLETESGIDLVGEAANGREAIQAVERFHPDVILMDIVMPELDGIGAIREIRARNSDARILVLTTFTTDDKLFPAIEAGASGYLLKNTEPEELVRAIRQVHDGDYSLSQTIAQRVLQRISWRSEAPPTTDPLTEREVEVLALIARGLANKQIAEKLVISEATVRTHVGHILGKLHLASRTQAALYALREGLASLFDEGGGE
jgi:NarL family two-component system response regulator LiaR